MATIYNAGGMFSIFSLKRESAIKKQEDMNIANFVGGWLLISTFLHLTKNFTLLTWYVQPSAYVCMCICISICICS